MKRLLIVFTILTILLGLECPTLAACRRGNDQGIPPNKLTSTFVM